MIDHLVAEGRLIWLLEQTAEAVRPCRFCGKKIYFVRLKSNKLSPLTAEAANHFQDCPHYQKQAEPNQVPLFDARPDPL